MNTAQEIAKILLNVGAVKLAQKEPFIFASGLKSPIYCDNRVLLGFVLQRQKIIDAFCQMTQSQITKQTIIAGTATAGIAWAAWIANQLALPCAYVRGQAKDHGTKSLIEGAKVKNQQVILIEDLVSTGESLAVAAQALQSAGAEVVQVCSIFSYEFPLAQNKFKTLRLNFSSLSSFSILCEVARQTGQIKAETLANIKTWNQDPQNWQGL